MSRVTTFEGHGISAIVGNIVLAVIPLIFIFLAEFSIGIGVHWVFLVICTFSIILFPHQTYLFFEAKHLIDKNGLVDNLNLTKVAVFGSLSLLGLALQVITLIRLINLFNFGIYGSLAVIPLSLVASLGACLGLTDLSLFQGFWPPLLFKHLKLVFKNSDLTALCLRTTILLALLILLFL